MVSPFADLHPLFVRAAIDRLAAQFDAASVRGGWRARLTRLDF